MSKYYLDAGTTYSKIIEVKSKKQKAKSRLGLPAQQYENKNYYIIPSKMLKTIDIEFERICGHMGGKQKTVNGRVRLLSHHHENEIIALAKGCEGKVCENATVLDLGSRDAKWIRFKDGKFKDMDWNTSCASSTGATVEMLLKFYDVKLEELEFAKEKFPVTCGIFGLEKIMDDISKGTNPEDAISKFIHGIAYNTWSFAKKPEKIYLSGGFCENKCFVDSLKNYCDVELLGRFVLCEGLINGES
ncbi:MAG: BadF/BadG/BcrA/BcrD ATPase family protein [Candidatus Gastranaerophilales bacterium]|nr:BadF/BadG/BcrA/BcrD ATPase family protein [Candidatus Gastranaerophilales bacterium]